MTTSEQLERETEQTRAQILESLNELRARMTPGQMVDQLVDYMSESSGGMFFRNLSQQVSSNPLPVTLMGAGLAWLAMSSRRANGRPRSDVSASRARDTDAGRAAESVQQTGRDWAQSTRSVASDARARTSQTMSGMRDSAQVAGSAIADVAASTYDEATRQAGDAASRLQGAAISAAGAVSEGVSTASGLAADQAHKVGEQLRGSASRMRSNINGAGRSMMDFLYEQPLVLAGVGLAIGAAIGAALPITEAENEMLGERSEALKEQAGEVVEEQFEKSKAAAGQAWDAARDEFRSEQAEEGGAKQSEPVAGEAPLVPKAEGGEKEREEAEQLGHG